MRILVAATVSAWLLGASPARAGEATSLTYQEAIALGLRGGVPLKAAAARVEEARGHLGGVSPLLKDNPEVSGSVGARQSSGGQSGLDWSIGLSQPFELPGRRGARIEGAEAGVRREEAVKANVQRTYLAEVARQFAYAVFARDQLALLRRDHQISASLLQTTQRRREAGDVSLLELNVSKVAEAQARAQVLVAEAEARTAASSLASLLSLPDGTELTVAGKLPEVQARVADGVERGQERPDVRALREELSAAEADGRLGAAEAWPDFAVGAQYEREGQESVVQGLLRVTLPVFSRGQQLRQVSSARVTRLRAELDALRLDAARSVERAQLLEARNAEAVRLLEAEAVPLAVQNEELAQTGYAAGELSLAELMLIRREAVETKTQFLGRQLEAALSRIGLAAALGVFP